MDTNPGFFSEPVTELPDMGELNLPTSFPNQFEGVRPAAAPSAPSNVDPFAGQLAKELSKGPSFDATTAPTFFNWDASNADRYINSEYYKQLGFRPDRDNETLYGEHQTFGDMMQQAFAGAGELAWNTFNDGWKGWVRLIDSMVHWDASLLMGRPEELEALNREQNRIMNKYAIFHTPDSDGSIFSRQFLGDMIQQSGFAVGTMAEFAAEELLTMGTATLLKGGTIGMKLANLSRWARTGEILADMKRLGDLPWKTKTAARLFEGLKNVSTVSKFVPGVGGLVEGGLDVLRGYKKGEKFGQLFLTSLNGLRRTMSEANMAFTESRMEAAGTYGELKDQLYQSTLQEKGSVSPYDMDRIEDMAQKAAWSNFWINAGVISISNRLEYDNLFRKFGADKRATREMVEAGELAAKDAIDPKYFQKVTGASVHDLTGASGKVTVKAGEDFTKVYEKGAFGTFGNLRKISADFGRKTAAWEATKSLGRNLFKWEVDEGLQELIQEGSNTAMKQYYTDLYMYKAAGTSDDYINKALQDLSNTNGLKVFLMGAATGRLLAPIHKGIGFLQDRLLTNSAQREAARTERQEAIGTVNTFFQDTGAHTKESIEATIKDFYRDPARYAPEGIANLKAQNRASEVMEQAIKDNNKYLYEHAKDGAFAKAVMAAKKLNMVESMVDTIRAYGDHFDEKEFYEAFKVDFKDHEDRRSVKEYMNKLADNVQQFSDRVDLLRNKYADVVRPELYAGDDRKKMEMVKRALDDTIEWMAVSEYRANRTAERGMSILEEAAKLPTIGSSAHLIFRLLGDNDSLRGEMMLLDKEIASLKEGNLQDESSKKELELKEEQRRILGKLGEPGEGPANQRKTEHAIKVNFDVMEPDTVIDILREFGNVTNKALGNNTEVMPDDAADVYFKLRDYRQLSKDQKNFLDVYAFLANRKDFTRTFVRVLEGQQHLQSEQIREALRDALQKANDADDSAKNIVVNDLTEDELQAGKPLDEYHGFRAGDKILNTGGKNWNTLKGSEYIILRITTTGVQWQDTEDDTIKGIMDLDRFDKLVGAKKIVKVAEEKAFNAEFGEGENKQMIDGLGGVFIVQDNDRKDKPFVLTDENNRELNASGQVVAEGEEPSRYEDLQKAKEARDSILDARKKAQDSLDAPFVFDGKKMKYGTILVKEEEGKKKRFKVVSKGVVSTEGEAEGGPSPEARDDSENAGGDDSGTGEEASGTDSEDANSRRQLDSIELEPLGGGQTFTIDSMEGYELATEAAQRPRAGKKDGAYRIPSIHYLVQAQGVEKNGEGQEAANERLQEFIRKTPPNDLQKGLVIRVSKNPNQKKARPARENAADQNDLLEEHDSNIVAELRFNNETIGYLPFFDQYNYKDESGTVKIKDLTVEQFQAIVDTGDQDPYALLAEFQRYYQEAQKVYMALSDKVRDSGHKDIKDDKLKELFTVYSSAGDIHWTEKAETPLKELRYNGVGGKRVLLIQALTRDDKGMSDRKSVVVVEGGLSAEEQKKLEERIEQERYKEKNGKTYDMAAGLGEYVAVVELPNKELRFIPLDLPSMSTKDMDAIVQRINEQSAKTKKENLIIEDGAAQEDSGSFNAKFNGELNKEFFIHVPALGRGLWVDLSLNPKGDLLVSFRNANTGKPQLILLQGGAQVETPLSFSSFSDLLSKLNEAIKAHDASATAENRIGLEVTEAHFKKHMADLSSNQPGMGIDFGTIANTPAFVDKEVLDPAVLTVTSNSDIGDPLDVFLRKLASAAYEQEAAKKQTPPPGDNSGSNNGDTKKEKKKKKKKEKKEKEKENNKGVPPNENPDAENGGKKPEGLISEMMKLEKELETLPNDIYLELLDPELEKKAEKEKEGGEYDIDIKALRDKAENDPRVKAKRDRIAAIRAEIKKDRKGKANKVLTHEKLLKAHVEEIQRFKKWMDANLPDFIDIDLQDLIVQNMGKYGITVGQFIYQLDKLGQKKDIRIVTDPNAPYKYHEAFHAIFRLLLTDEQIDRLMSIARQEVRTQLRNKKTTMAAELEEMRRLAPEEYGGLSDEQLEERYYEEHLADRFEHWKTDTDREKDNWLKQFFRWLYGLIRKLNKNFTKGELDGLFREINAGKFKGERLAINRFTREAQETLAPQVVLKSIKIGEIGVRDEDGEEMLVNEYLPEGKGTALTSAIAGTYYERMMKMRAEKSDESPSGDSSKKAANESPLAAGDSSGKVVPDTTDAGIAAEDVLEQVLKDYAQLYDRDNPKYLAKLTTKETAREYWAMLPELDKLKRLFENGREEIKDAVRVHLRHMNLMQNEEAFKIEDVQDDLGDRAMVDFHKNKESIGGFEALSKWFRQYIATTTYEGKDLYGNTELKEGEPLLQAVDANRVYSGILKLVAGTDSIHEMLLRMQQVAEKKEYGYANEHSAHFIKRFFSDLGIVVTKDDYEVRKEGKRHLFNMVMKGLQQYRTDYIFFSKELGKKDTKIVLSNRRESKRKQFSIWYNAFGEVFFQKYKRKALANQPKFLKEAIAGLKQFQKLARLGEITDEGLERQSREISEKLEKGLGMNMHPLFIQYSLLSPIKEKNLTPAQLRLMRSLPAVEWMRTEDVSTFIQQLEDGKNPFVWNKDASDVEGDTEDDRGEAVSLTSRLMDFAESNALFDESVNVSSFTNADKETVYGHQLPTFHLLKITELRSDLKDPDRYLDDAFLKDNFLATRDDVQQMAGDLKVSRLDGMNSYYSEDEDFYSQKEGSKRKGVTYGDFTEREMLLALFELYGVNKGYKRADGSWFRTSRHLIRVLEASNTGDTVNLPVFKAVERDAKGNVRLSAQTMAALKQEVRREFDRIGRVKQEIAQIEEEKKTGKRVTKEIDGYHNVEKNSGPRGLTLFKTRIMLGTLADELEKEAQQEKPDFDQFEERLELQFKQYWIEGTNDTKSQLDQLIDTLVDRSIIQKKNGKLKNVLLPQFMGTEVKDEEKDKEVRFYAPEGLFLEADHLKQNIAQVMLNDFINTQSINQLLLGDQAESLVDYVDMVKRAKGANASGPSTAFDITAPELGIEHAGLKSHIVQFDDPKFFAKYLGKNMEKADAQMWMTTKFLRYTLFGLGKLTPSEAALLDKIERGESVNVEDIYGKGGSVEYDGQTNSIKLVYYDGHRYIKTSGFLLTKELTSRWDKDKEDWVARKGYKELHQLRTKLEDFEKAHETICSAVPKSASKGEKANTARGIMPTMENGKWVDPISDWNFQELDNRYWRLQTENPSNKIEITDPTQAKQLILAEQDDNTKVYFPWSDKEKPITVGQLKKIYLETTAQRARVKYRQARDKIFGFEEALTEIQNSADLGKVTPKLEAFLKKAVDILRISAADSQLLEFFSLDEGGKPRYNLNHPSTLDKFTQLFLAYFTKGVMNEKVPGHALTLVSSYGMRVLKKVLEVGSDGQPKRWEVITRHQYEQNPEEYEDALEWEGDPTRREFLTLADKFTTNGKRPTYILDDLRHMVPEYALNDDGTIKIDKATGKEVILGHYTEYMTAAHDPQVMELIQQYGGRIPDAIAKAFGVRIPSQDKHSFINLKLVDFLPAHYGSSGVFAPELVEISGADFDVDKLYVSTKEYYVRRPLKKRQGWRGTEEDEDDFDHYEEMGPDILSSYGMDSDSAGAEDQNFFYHFTPRKDEGVEWVAYGSATTDKGRFNEFVRYQKEKNKEFRKEYYKRIAASRGYAKMQQEAQALGEEIEAAKGVDSKKIRAQRQEHSGLVKQLKKIQSDATLGALKELGLPDSEKAYMRKVRDEGEQNIGVLNNKLVDAKIQLLGNEHMLASRESGKLVGGDANEQREALKDVASTTTALEQVLQKNPDAIQGIYGVSSFETSKGSVYTVLPNGKTQRYKTATQEQNEPQDLMVFVKFKDQQQEQGFLEGVQRSEETHTKVYVTDRSGKKYDTNEQIIGNDVRLVLVDTKKNEVIDTVETSLTPKEGFNTFDQRRFKKDGETYRESHLGNTVSSITRASAGELAELYHKAKADGSNPGLVKVVENAVRQTYESPTGDSSGKRKENPIAFEVASVKPLQQLLEDFKNIFKDVKSLMPILEEGNVDVDTFIGKLLAFRNNKEGAKNIGPAVNSMLAYALLNTFKVKMREHMSYEDYKGETKNNPIWKFKLDGVEFNSYEHTRAYNPKTGEFDGERIMHHISTIVSAMTDNAKERLAAKLGLNIEAVGLVSNLIAQGVPMDKAVMFMLQPVVRDYYKRTSNLSAAVKTEEEEDVNKYAIGENMLEDLAKKLGKDAAEPVELTSEVLRDNILTEGTNKQYEYAVLNSFLKLRKQSEYFNDVSGVMKVVKGMQTSHEDDDQLEEKIDNLGLNDSDENFNRTYIPFDLRQVMRGVDKSKPFNDIVAEYLKNFDEIRLLSQKVFIERTKGFRYITDVISKNLRARGFQKTEFNKKLKKDLLSFLSIKAYMKLLRDDNRLERLSTLTPALLFDGAAAKNGKEFKDIIDTVNEIRRVLPENKFAKNFLNLVPTYQYNEDGILDRNPYNRKGINRAEINTWAKLDALQIEQLQSSFLEILQNEETRPYAWTLFHYLLVKDGGQFRNGSFIRYLPNAMFKDLQDATNKVNKVMITGFEDGDFDEVFGVEYYELINEFVEGYLLNVTNTKYAHKVDIHQQTADLVYKERSPTSEFSSTKTELSKEEQKEVDDYVPQTFTVKDGDETIEIDLTGGIREDPSERKEYDKIEKAKYAKNIDSLKLRGFRMGKMAYTKKSRTGDYNGTGQRNAVELPLVLRHEVMTESGPISVLYLLSELEDEKGNWKSIDDDLTGIFQPGEHIARSTRARYALYGSPDGHSALWGGSFMFGNADTSASPRERTFVENYGGFDVDDESEPEGEPAGGRKPLGTPLPNMAVEDFKQQFGVDSIDLVDGQLVFLKNGEELPNQEFLYKAYKLLQDAYAKGQPVEEEEDDDDDDESSETSGSFYLDEDDEDDEDEGEMKATPTAEEQQRYEAMVKVVNEGPLGC